MRLPAIPALPFRALASFFLPDSLAACASIAGDFTTHPVDSGTTEDSSVDASTDGAEDAPAMDSSSPTDAPSKGDTGTDAATQMEAGSDAATCTKTQCGT